MTNFIIEFETLAMKANIDKLHVIFLLKKNMRQDIIKMILGYPPITALKTLKEWKMAIISVKYEYEFIKKRNDYKMSTEVTYGEWKQLMNIRKSNENFKNKKPCFNYNKYKSQYKRSLL